MSVPDAARDLADLRAGVAALAAKFRSEASHIRESTTRSVLAQNADMLEHLLNDPDFGSTDPHAARIAQAVSDALCEAADAIEADAPAAASGLSVIVARASRLRAVEFLRKDATRRLAAAKG